MKCTLCYNLASAWIPILVYVPHLNVVFTTKTCCMCYVHETSLPDTETSRCNEAVTTVFGRMHSIAVTVATVRRNTASTRGCSGQVQYCRQHHNVVSAYLELYTERAVKDWVLPMWCLSMSWHEDCTARGRNSKTSTNCRLDTSRLYICTEFEADTSQLL